jgi:hypothetical protein
VPDWLRAIIAGDTHEYSKCRVGHEEIKLDELHMVLKIELELAQIADLEEKKGFEDGRGLQARLERIALSCDEDIEERGELLEQGLP